LDINGSPEFDLNWREQDIGLGPPVCRLAPSARRTAASGCSGWPTQNGNNEAGNNDFSRKVVAIASAWSTPRASDGEKGGPNMKFGAGGTPLPAQAASAWRTPNAYTDPEKAAKRQETGHQLNLSEQVLMAWATPRVGETCDRTSRSGYFEGLSNQARAASGPTPSGSPERTEKRGAFRGVLNAVFVGWLMNFPPEWILAGLAVKAKRSRSSLKECRTESDC
jgi:hypothetical protein